MRIIFLPIFFFFPFITTGQQPADSLRTLDEVIIRSFEQNSRRNSSSPVMVIDKMNADRDNKTSLVQAFNSIPGVRMEERSPGSYRINIRGSSLRAPFGVRNVKVYWNDLPLTDAGGNTYFNQLAWNNFSFIEIYKGPAASMYGAGTGGLILLRNEGRWEPGLSLEYISGSYGLHNVFASARFGSDANTNQMTYSHNQSAGYREQASMRRDNFSWHSVLKHGKKQEMSASLLFTGMDYQTPGALTLAEYTRDPRASRPAAGGFPSAVNARAAIYQHNLLAGFTHSFMITESWKNTSSLYGMYNQVKNPAIRNYERRKEPGFGGRSVFIYHKQKGPGYFRLVGGAEFSEGDYNIQVSKNREGQPDTLQVNDDVRNSNYSVFLQGDIPWGGNWSFTGGMSLNFSRARFTRLSNYPVTRLERSFRNELAPRFSIQRKWENMHSLGIIISKGFSPPTVAEILPSTSVLNTELEAEQGWNYELTGSASLLKNRLQLNLNAFYYRLDGAIVQRRDLSGADFFVNAGDTRQKGIELGGIYKRGGLPGILDQLQSAFSYSYQHFRYGKFARGTEDHSGNMIPSVPAHTVSISGIFQFDNGLLGQLTYFQASGIFLDDANRFSAGAYHLLGIRIGWRKTLDHHRLQIYAGIENALDEKYSLGNDINAPAGRFFNAAPARNYYTGIAWQWIRD